MIECLIMLTALLGAAAIGAWIVPGWAADPPPHDEWCGCLHCCYADRKDTP